MVGAGGMNSARHLQGVALFGFAANLSRADLVCDGVAGTFEGAPHVPACDRAIGAPAFAKGEELFGFGHVLLAVGDRPAFLHAEVVDGENIGAAEAKDQEHLDGPGADAADADKTLDEFLIRHGQGLFVRGHDAPKRLSRQILHRENFCAGEAGFAEDRLAQLEHLFRGGRAAVAA